MESIGLYLLKSAVWLTGFAFVFLLILRNERYFRLNRVYLLSGIIASIVFPFYTWHYTVILPFVQDTFITTSGTTAVAMAPPPTVIPVYFWFYIVGILGLAFRMIWQTGKVVRKLRKAGYVKTGSVKLVRMTEYEASFSFFSYVFVNPSIADIETEEIVNHEREHIGQRHWFDLLLVELLCMLQWFNPFVWIYARLIRQNH
ncbi:MAG TPA: TonB family protein, partial [Prolixibacteraceae bacterium]